MPLPSIPQPEVLPIAEDLRLRRLDVVVDEMVQGYKDPVVYQNSKGIFDESRIPDRAYVQGMCNVLRQAGEMYYIEINENGRFVPVGDVTLTPVNLPIALWRADCRGRGIGTRVMQAALTRLAALGYAKVTGQQVFIWNRASQNLHESLGFMAVRRTDRDIIYEIDLTHFPSTTGGVSP